jgi:hypothetical protein
VAGIQRETGFLAASLFFYQDLGKKPGFWGEGKETGFLAASLFFYQDLRKKPGFCAAGMR